MADGAPIIGFIIGFVALTLGLLTFSQMMPIAIPFFTDIINSNISPFAAFLYGIIPFMMVIILIFKTLA